MANLGVNVCGVDFKNPIIPAMKNYIRYPSWVELLLKALP